MVAHTSRHLLTSEGIKKVDLKPEAYTTLEGNLEQIQETEAYLASLQEPRPGNFSKLASKILSGLAKSSKNQSPPLQQLWQMILTTSRVFLQVLKMPCEKLCANQRS